MPTAMTTQVSIDLPQSEAERIVRDGTLMRMDGTPAAEVARWMREQVGRHVKVRDPSKPSTVAA